MIPVLYEATESTFNHKGIGELVDTISGHVVEERNGAFELELVYPVDGPLYGEIKRERLIKAKANDDANMEPQLFRIYSITRTMSQDGQLTVNVKAKHISYDLMYNPLKKVIVTDSNAQGMLDAVLGNTLYPHSFTGLSDDETVASSTLEHVSAREALGGTEGSLLDNWRGEFTFDNFLIKFMQNRGEDNGVIVEYGKNLTDAEQDEAIDETVTAIYPYAKIQNDDQTETIIELPEKTIDSEYVSSFATKRCLYIDLSGDDVTDEDSLRSKARSYLTSNNIGKPKVSLTISFIQLWQTTEYQNVAPLEHVNLCDWVIVRFKKLGIDVKAKVIKTDYDVLLEQYISVDLGDPKSDLADDLAAVQQTADGAASDAQQAISNANTAIQHADGTWTFYGSDEPVGNIRKGSLWFKKVNGDYTEMYRYDGVSWVKQLSNDANDAKQSAQEALDQANAAVDKANQLSDDVGGAVDTATEAINTANASKTASQAAQDTAANAASDAAEAKDNAAAAMTEAQSKADADSVYTKTEVDEALDAYAKVTTVDTLTGRVDSAETRITETESEIMVKADKSTVDTLTGQVSTLSTEVSTQADQIAARITKTDADAKYATQTSLKATNDSLLVNINQVQTNLDDLQVGGTNLIPNSDVLNGQFIKVGSYNGTRTVVDDSEARCGKHIEFACTAAGSGWYCRVFNKTADKIGKTYTWSFWAKCSVAKSGQVGHEAGGETNISLTTEWKKFQYTWTFTDNPIFAFTFYMGWNVGEIFYIRDFKIETGNKATDWSPAPEDLATATQFTQLSASLDGISTQVGRKLDTDTFNSYKTQTASTIANLLTKSDASGTYVTQSAWTQKNNSISSEINQAQTDAQNYADSRVTQTANSLQTTITAIKNKDKEKCIDPSFENGLISIFGDAFMAVGSDNGNYHSGTKSIRASGQSNTSYICNFPVYPGMKIRLSWWVRTTDDFTCATDNTKIRIMLNGVHWVEADLLWTKGVKTDWTYDEKVVTIPDQPTSGQMFFTATVNTMIQSGVMKIDDVSIMDVTDEQQVQSQISQLSDDINLRVQKNDVVNQINVSTESILIAGKKIHITGDTTFDSGVVKAQNIDVANLAALSADLGTVTAGNLKAVTITGSVITGSTIQTATSGPRIELSGNILQGYAANGSEYLRVDTTAGGALQLTRSSSATIANLWGGGALMLGNYDTNKWIGAGQPSDWGVGWSGDNNWLVFGNPGGLDPAETAFDSNVCLGANNQIMVNWGGSLGGFLRLTTEDVGGGTVLDRATINIGAAGYSLSKCPKIYADGYNQLGIANADVYINNGKHLIIGNFDLNSAHTFSSLDGGKVYFATNDDGGPAISIQAASFDKASQIGLKENFAPMDPVEALTNILNTDVVRYNYKGNPELQVGLVIDDRQQPEYHAAADFVTADREAAKTDTIVGELMLAVKALHEKNQELESRIAQLEAA